MRILRFCDLLVTKRISNLVVKVEIDHITIEMKQSFAQSVKLGY